MKKYIITFFLLFSIAGISTTAMASADLDEKSSFLFMEKEKSENKNSDKGEDTKDDLYIMRDASLFLLPVSLISLEKSSIDNDGYADRPLKPPRN